jgi:hypothetical protein
MNNTEYGKHVRERQQFNQSILRSILGKDSKPHVIAILRKAAPGVGQFADITKKMSKARLAFIRQRARRTTLEARQREWIIGNPFAIIKKRILA